MSRHRAVPERISEEVFYLSEEKESPQSHKTSVSPDTEFLYQYKGQSESLLTFLPSSAGGKKNKQREKASAVVDVGKQLCNDDQRKLNDCLEAMRNVTGDLIPEYVLREAATSQGFNVEKALNVVLDNSSSSSVLKSLLESNKNTGNAEFSLADLLTPSETSIDSILKTNECQIQAPIGLELLLNPSATTDNPLNLLNTEITLEDILGQNESPKLNFDLNQCLSASPGNFNTNKLENFMIESRVPSQGATPDNFSEKLTYSSSALDDLHKNDEMCYKLLKNWHANFLRKMNSYRFDDITPEEFYKKQKKEKADEKSTPRNLPPVETPSRLVFNGTDVDNSDMVQQLVIEQTNRPRKPKKPVEAVQVTPQANVVDLKPKAGQSQKKVPVKDIEQQYEKERLNQKPLLNLVVVGHVDAGKSTLLGHLLYLLGDVTKKVIDKYTHEAKKLGKSSFAYAWVLDETAEERSRGITMDTAYAKLETENRQINILDAPGHRDFIPNMITGASQADAAVLVIDATTGEFETGFESGGQTREHTTLVRSLGVNQLIVAINKLDTCGWSKERFNQIETSLRPFLKQTGFTEQNVCHIPCSGLHGENIHKRSEDKSLCAWYSGPCLVEAIDNLKPPTRVVSQPFRMSVSNTVKGTPLGCLVTGRVESGSVATGDKIMIMPAKEITVVKSISIDDRAHLRAFAGDRIAIAIEKSVYASVINGSILCDIDKPVRCVSKFQMQLVLFNIDTPLIKGSSVILQIQSLSVPANISKILKQLDRNNGQVVREKPRMLPNNSSGLVEIKVTNPICIELYKEVKSLGRITLRQDGQTIAAGVVTALL